MIVAEERPKEVRAESIENDAGVFFSPMDGDTTEQAASVETNAEILSPQSNPKFVRGSDRAKLKGAFNQRSANNGSSFKRNVNQFRNEKSNVYKTDSDLPDAFNDAWNALSAVTAPSAPNVDEMQSISFVGSMLGGDYASNGHSVSNFASTNTTMETFRNRDYEKPNGEDGEHGKYCSGRQDGQRGAGRRNRDRSNQENLAAQQARFAPADDD